MVAEGKGALDDFGEEEGEGDDDQERNVIREENKDAAKSLDVNGDSVKAPLVVIDKIDANHDDAEKVAVRQVTDGNQAQANEPSGAVGLGMSEGADVSPIVDLSAVKVPE